jgi:hypothetical protein
MPYLMLSSPYIPGQPGFQIDMTLTSEHASLYSRLRNELVLVKSTGNLIRLLAFTRSMRAKAGVHYQPQMTSKPNYLLLVNSFFGLETPKDLPPLAAAVGPILSDEYPPLSPDEPYIAFLEEHKRVVYVALGSHIMLKNTDAVKFVQGFSLALDQGIIDGVIWAVGASGQQEFDLDFEFTLNHGKDDIQFRNLLDNKSPNWLFTTFAPQRALLDHESVQVYLTHGGGSSANEG